MRHRFVSYAPLASSSPAVAGFRPAGAALAIAGAFLGAAHAQTSGLQAIHGAASMVTQGNQTIVTTQNGAGTSHSALNWQSFGVAAGTTTQFNQPNANSTAINRVLGNNPSAIFGTLSSNGKLVLVNPAGIAVGAGAVVDTAGFTASTLRMSDADALAGRMRFGDGGISGGLSVGGHIVARGGDVVLIAPNIETSQNALIQSPSGATVLAAGQKVEVTGRGLEGIHLQVQAPQDSAVNLGTIKGDAVGIFAGTLRHSGLISATQASAEGGKVMLKGQDTAEISGAITARKGNLGGQVHATANKVKLKSGAVIEASGAAGGGEVLIGGGWQGKDARIANAAETVAEAGSTIRADATDNGNGGTVVLWADGATWFDGAISTRGGAHGGDGGQIETSGKQSLSVGQVSIDARAAAGRTGNWLLDPTNFTIAGGTGATTADTIYENTLETAGAHQTITSAAGGAILASGTFAGNDINMPAGISLTLNGDGGIDLTTSTHGTGLVIKGTGAAGAINMTTANGAIILGSVKAAGGAVSLNAGGAAGNLTVREITTNPATFGAGGAITLQSAGNMTLGAAGANIDARGTGGGTSGNVTLTSGGSVAMQSGQNVYAGDLQVSAASGISNGAGGQMRVDASRLQARNSGSGSINIVSVGTNGIILDNLGGGQAVSQGTAGGSVHIGSTQGVLTVNAAIATTNGDVLLESDKMALVGTTNAGTANVTLRPVNNGTVIDLGSATNAAGGRLELSSAELGTITAGILKLGASGYTGGIEITDNITIGSAGAVSMINNASITASTGKTITTDKLNVHSYNGSVSLAEANAVNTVAGKAGSGQTFSFKSAGALTVGTVDINSGVEVTNGVIGLESPGLLTVGQNVAGGTGTITLQGVGVTLGSTRTVNAQNVILEGTTGAVNTGAGTVTAGTGVFVNSGSAVTLGNTTGGSNITISGVSGGINQENGTTLNTGGVLTAVTTGGAITLGNATNVIATLGSVSSPSGGVTIVDSAGGLYISQGVSAGTGALDIRTAGGGISTTSTSSMAGNGITLKAAGASSDISLAASLNAGSGALLLEAGLDVAFAATGSMGVSAGSATITHGATGALKVSGGGQHTLNVDLDVTDLQVFSGSLILTKTLNNQGSTKIQGGTGEIKLSGVGAAFINHTGKTLDIQNAKGITGDGTAQSVQNFGLIKKTFDTGTASIAGNNLSFTNAANAQIIVDTGTLSFATPGMFETNSGRITIASGATLSNAPTATFTNNAGALIEGSGTLNLGGQLLTNNGSIKPGGANTVGTLNVNGGFDGGSGTLELDLLNPGSYDKLLVTGNITVANPGIVLSPVAMSGANWAIGDTFNVVQRSASGGSASGSLTSPTGFSASLVSVPTPMVVLTASSASPAPAPAGGGGTPTPPAPPATPAPPTAPPVTPPVAPPPPPAAPPPASPPPPAAPAPAPVSDSPAVQRLVDALPSLTVAQARDIVNNTDSVLATFVTKLVAEETRQAEEKDKQNKDANSVALTGEQCKS